MKRIVVCLKVYLYFKCVFKLCYFVSKSAHLQIQNIVVCGVAFFNSVTSDSISAISDFSSVREALLLLLLVESHLTEPLNSSFSGGLYSALLLLLLLLTLVYKVFPHFSDFSSFLSQTRLCCDTLDTRDFYFSFARKRKIRFFFRISKALLPLTCLPFFSLVISVTSMRLMCAQA